MLARAARELQVGVAQIMVGSLASWAVLGPSWGPLGLSLGHLGGLLGRHRSWGDLGGLLGRLEPSESRKEGNANILQKPKENQ